MKSIFSKGILVYFIQASFCVGGCNGLVPSTVDHLVPLQENHGLLLKYDRLSREKLLVTPGEMARFMSLPGSASVETSVSVYQAGGRTGSFAGDYWVTVTQATKSVWEAMQSDSDPGSLRVERLDAPLPEAVAQIVHKAWLSMLMQMQIKPVSTSEEVMVDSTQEIFSAAKVDGSIVEGQASAHPGPRSKALLGLAFYLIEYCEKPAALRQKVANNIENHAAKLIEHAN